MRGCCRRSRPPVLDYEFGHCANRGSIDRSASSPRLENQLALLLIWKPGGPRSCECPIRRQRHATPPRPKKILGANFAELSAALPERSRLETPRLLTPRGCAQGQRQTAPLFE